MARAAYQRIPKQKVGGGVPMTYHGTFTTKAEAEKRAKSAAKALGTAWSVRKRKNGYAVYLA